MIFHALKLHQQVRCRKFWPSPFYTFGHLYVCEPKLCQFWAFFKLWTWTSDKTVAACRSFSTPDFLMKENVEIHFPEASSSSGKCQKLVRKRLSGSCIPWHEEPGEGWWGCVQVALSTHYRRNEGNISRNIIH